MNKIKMIMMLPVIAMLICSMSVCAANRNIALSGNPQEVDNQEKGSIEIELTDGSAGTSKEGVVFQYDKVAEVIDGEYKLCSEYEKSGIDLNEIERAEELDKAAKTFCRYRLADGTCRTDADGKAVIEDLEVGVYLLYATETKQYEEITPVLVAIPIWGEAQGDMLYDVKVIPKHAPKIPEREIVKTGDSAIPYRLTGLVIISVSVVLAVCYKKKQYNEK